MTTGLARTCTVVLCAIIAYALPTAALAQSQPALAPLIAKVRSHREARARDILDELRALVALPNVASNRADIERNAARLQQMFERRGFTSRRLTAGEAMPAVYAERATPGASRTIVFYAHYDGQPIDASAWSDPPWQPTLRSGPREQGGAVIPWDQLPASLPADARLYGRSTSDDKAPIVAFLAAVDALDAAGSSASVNLKVFLEGEEEAGSPHLAGVLRAHRDLLRADLWIFGDGPVHQSRRPLVSFGVRGTVGLELTLYGPSRTLHSGHYGNWAPNPAAELVTVLAGMRDDDGRIFIAGVMDKVRPVDDTERAANAALPAIEDALMRELALGRTEAPGTRLGASLMRPALNVRGLRAGGVGSDATNAIPTTAQASLDFRLVPDLTPADVEQLVEAHLRARGYHIVHDAPTADDRRHHPRLIQLKWGSGYPGFRTSMSLPVSRAVVALVAQASGQPVVEVPTLGGSLPLYLIADILDVPIITVPIVNHDNNQHAANENLRLQNLWDGIDVYAALLAGLGDAW